MRKTSETQAFPGRGEHSWSGARKHGFRDRGIIHFRRQKASRFVAREGLFKSCRWGGRKFAGRSDLKQSKDGCREASLRPTADNPCGGNRASRERPSEGRLSVLTKTRGSRILAIQKVAHGFAARRIGSLVGFQGIGGLGIGRLFFTARRTAIGEARLARLQLEFLSANHALFYREVHVLIIWICERASLE
jgi:hypothetical protein